MSDLKNETVFDKLTQGIKVISALDFIKVKPLLFRLALSIKWLCKRAGDLARLSGVTELRMLESGRSSVFVTETVLRY